MKIHTRTTQQNPSQDKYISVSLVFWCSGCAADRRYKQLQHKTLCLCLCSIGGCNPSGNKQKTSVRTDEPAAVSRGCCGPVRWCRLAYLSPKAAVQFRNEVAGVTWLCPASRWWAWARQPASIRQHFLSLTSFLLLCRGFGGEGWGWGGGCCTGDRLPFEL